MCLLGIRVFGRNAVKQQDRQPRWGTRREAADYAKCSARTIDRWLSEGKITGTKVGNIVRVNLAEIDRLFAGGDAA